jgi:histidine kinase/DNA gyrase B/HSP90-like ATPase
LPEDKNVEGTGIALTICNRLIESMNGSIKMNSEKANGSTVSLIILLSQSGQKLVTESLSFQPPPKDKKSCAAYISKKQVYSNTIMAYLLLYLN